LRPLILFILIFAWVSACAPASHKHRKRYRKAYPDTLLTQKHKKTVIPSQPKATRQKPRAVLSGSVKSSLLPTILNERDKTLMILIDAGKSLISKDTNSTDVDLTPDKLASEFKNIGIFYIDRTEISVAHFRQYEPNYNEKPFTGGKDCPKCPAMAINWIQASKYCRWAGKRLPREEEWEAAARGITHYSYPWGETFRANHSNLWGADDGYLFSAPVGSFQAGASASGVMDMAGNVWEWVDTKKSAKLQPDTRIVKGGGWTSNEKQASISFRNLVNLNMKNPTFGFRCAKSLDEQTHKREIKPIGRNK
jgi:formylglycine-generating enzyme